MNEQELIERIILEIEKYGIEVIGDNYFPLDAVTNNRKKITIFNPTTVKAFKLCHELMHIKNNDSYRLGECDTTSPQEKRTNKEAILFLWDIFITEGGNFELFQKFIEISGCPCDTAFALLCKLNEEVIKELKKEGNTQKDFSKMSLKECVIDYISHFDVVEQINTYQFLEAYNLPYESYDKAVELFKNMLKLDYAC
ncbi:hypothetical protein [Lactococcus garvieae]|jgi:hypothetical protein|uniref:hypothetical protein n=1 Tax=Lactococcus garvieae TaxID=1363 RepID=UPI000266BDD7|nr:hypothetical protein [Lactococcus garvieae]MDN5629289.1 hypothetical protein [Lactococcus sp.]EIT67115.1 Putative phage protein [Lactococcus garvieae IPLA 31405]MBS4462976.1 hypothetical protein [Lactococcus garvieae]MCO7129726.1 hypothetical protein [Lactococcus garvieae]MDB7634567.1 hypothetical protein [Lactococcus garvieae]